MRRLALPLAVALLALPAAAQAGTIKITTVVGTWSNGTPVANVTYANNGTQAPSANWGTGGPAQSGYDFVGAAPPTLSVTVPPSPSALFDLGSFTHRNQPINAGSSITGIRLTVGAHVFVDDIDLGTKNFVFDFVHNETDNGANPCANGQPNGAGVNVNGCADSVTFIYNSLSDSFNVGGIEYTLNLAGFVVGGNTVNEFWTTEQANNTAVLKGQVVERSTVVPDAGTTLLLLGLSLTGLTAMRKRLS